MAAAWPIITLLGLYFFASIVIAKTYMLVGQLTGFQPGSDWDLLGIAVFNAIVAGIFFLTSQTLKDHDFADPRHQIDKVPVFKGRSISLKNISRVWFYLPGPLLLIGLMALILITSEFATLHQRINSSPFSGLHLLATCAIAPMAEELLFRKWLTRFYFKASPNLWAIYFSALTFSTVHGMPTLSKLWSDANWPILIGPLLLGLVCEALYIGSKSIIPCIIFHFCANLTVYGYWLLPDNWQNLMRIFYQNSAG